MLEIGSIVDGKYKILNMIGKGGMSYVYLAMNEKANKQWAIKEVRKDGVKDFDVIKQSLIVETDMLKNLSHPYLPSIIDVIEDREKFLIVMDYIEGNSLEDAVNEYGAQPQEKVIEWAKQLCDVLGYLHSRTPAIIYRDMKPSNIMLKPDGNITLIDFGTAKEYKERSLADTTSLGTRGYAAPEQFGGKSDARTDIYCLGATIYHLVTGNKPYEKEIKPIREYIPTLSSGLEKIIIKCMMHNPDDRYQSAEELMYALEHYGEMDKIYINKQKKKLVAFISTVAMTFICAGVSAWGYNSAEKKRSENYNAILKEARSYEDYYDAILLDPARVEAYEGLNEILTEDLILTEEEGQYLQKLQIGLDSSDSSGYSTKEDVLKKLKSENIQGYRDVCYQIGESFLFYYDVSSDRNRYSSAATWFKEAIEDKKEYEHKLAETYCNIANCLEMINQYNGAKVKQTEKMYEQYRDLWANLNELKNSADEFESVDLKLQVWNEINNMIDMNLAHFLAITTKDNMKILLNAIDSEAEKVNMSVIEEDVNKLRNNISETIKRIDSSK